ncbi:MAG: HAMP domain-containing sensor histidine kinase, partial [Ferruginibacter sp.]
MVLPALAIVIILLVLGVAKLNARSIKQKAIALQKKVDAQTSELSKTVEVRELLINIISHDMATPLRYITFISQILAKGIEKDPEKIKSALLDINTTSEKILSGSLNILNLMKYSRQRIAVNKSTENISILVNDIIKIFDPVAKSKGITIQNDVEESVEAAFDYTILSVILNNIISNAVKYSEAEIIRVFLEKVIIPGETVLKITDNGIGISDERLRIINEVLRGNMEGIKTTSKLSTGLGYLMIAELIRIHNMNIIVESELGKSTTVTIKIPDSTPLEDE